MLQLHVFRIENEILSFEMIFVILYGCIEINFLECLSSFNATNIWTQYKS